MARPSIESLPVTDLTKLKDWQKLTAAEQSTIKREHGELTLEIVQVGKAWIAIGEHLAKIRDILEPHKVFDSYLKITPFGLSRATAYRRIRLYEQAKKILPSPFLRVALLRGVETLNVESIKAFPPPKTEDPKKMVRYFEELKGREKEQSTEEDQPETLKKISVNSVRRSYEKLPHEWSGKKKFEWMESLCGMLITIAGASSEMKIAPEAIPIDFMRGPGRPLKRTA